MTGLVTRVFQATAGWNGSCLDRRQEATSAMKLASIVGVVLVVLGVIALAYGGINYTRTEKVLDIGPLEATTETRERIPLPPVLGGVALIGGIALLVVGSRRTA